MTEKRLWFTGMLGMALLTGCFSQNSVAPKLKTQHEKNTEAVDTVIAPGDSEQVRKLKARISYLENHLPAIEIQGKQERWLMDNLMLIDGMENKEPLCPVPEVHFEHFDGDQPNDHRFHVRFTGINGYTEVFECREANPHNNWVRIYPVVPMSLVGEETK